jgi:hypothetical protein
MQGSHFRLRIWLRLGLSVTAHALTDTVTQNQHREKKG